MLTRIAGLPDTSAFRMAQDWPLLGHLLAGVVNEIRAMRGDLYAIHRNERMSFQMMLPPSAQRAEQAKRVKSRADHADIIARLRGEKRG